MRDTYIRLRNSQLFRYIFIGGISYVVELIVLLSLAKLLLFTPELSVGYSFWVGLVISFLLQKYVAFENKERNKRNLTRQSLFYGLLVLFNYVFTIAFVSVFTSLFGLILARTIALLLTVSWNYFVYKRIFK